MCDDATFAKNVGSYAGTVLGLAHYLPEQRTSVDDLIRYPGPEAYGSAPPYTLTRGAYQDAIQRVTLSIEAQRRMEQYAKHVAMGLEKDLFYTNPTLSNSYTPPGVPFWAKLRLSLRWLEFREWVATKVLRVDLYQNNPDWDDDN